MTKLLPPTDDGIAQAASLLRQGRLVAFGTETVYGLGGDATNAEAVANIFAAKGRPSFNPLICHYPSAQEALAHGVADERARDVAAHFWPGPLTLVLRRAADCPVALLASAGLDTLAMRVPLHPLAQSVLRQAGRPIAAPSANRSGRISPTTADHVRQELDGRIEAILDSGPCPVGVESTVLDLSGPTPVLLRPGGVTLEALQATLGSITHVTGTGAGHAGLRSPGMLESHYAPNLPVRLNATDVIEGEVLLAFGPPVAAARCLYQLSESANLSEAAARLFDGLRTLDRAGCNAGSKGIAVMPIPEAGLGVAINDRLRRAAAPRPAFSDQAE